MIKIVGEAGTRLSPILNKLSNTAYDFAEPKKLHDEVVSDETVCTRIGRKHLMFKFISSVDETVY